MTLRPCRCGEIPTFQRAIHGNVNTIRLVCKCGNCGAVIMYSKPDDQAKCEQAAADGWTLGG